ncbi:unnamed protein product [Polarella glacialis]|uniref:Uncharacterized protein n=1 Tax=Polarella glacialis TaxID=89957 RepID=A0A813II93_POLGL|nr:unnamed protein product [Polarella glacialis]
MGSRPMHSFRFTDCCELCHANVVATKNLFEWATLRHVYPHYNVSVSRNGMPLNHLLQTGAAAFAIMAMVRAQSAHTLGNLVRALKWPTGLRNKCVEQQL